ncbi:Crp/Fnr family transcriptional regulator [Larkinella harenae]
MENTVRWFLEKLEKFNLNEINALLEHTRIECFSKGDLIVRQGLICNTCYFVLKGCLRHYQIRDGEEKTTRFFLDGEPAVLYASYLKQTHYLSCVEDCILLTGTREQEQELHKKHPKLENLIHTLLFRDYDKAENYIALLNGYKPEDRYLMVLKNQPELLNRALLHQIARFLGVTPESLSRIRKRIVTK